MASYVPSKGLWRHLAYTTGLSPTMCVSPETKRKEKRTELLVSVPKLHTRRQPNGCFTSSINMPRSPIVLIKLHRGVNAALFAKHSLAHSAHDAGICAIYIGGCAFIECSECIGTCLSSFALHMCEAMTVRIVDKILPSSARISWIFPRDNRRDIGRPNSHIDVRVEYTKTTTVG